MLQHLTHSKHKTISQCSAGALKNLYAGSLKYLQDFFFQKCGKILKLLFVIKSRINYNIWISEFFLIAKPSGMLDMVSKGAAYGMPSLQARKRRNMVREMSDQLLDGPDKVKNNSQKKINKRKVCYNNFFY